MRLTKEDIQLEQGSGDNVVATFVLSKEQEAQFAAVKSEGYTEETIKTSDFIITESGAEKQSVLMLPMNTFGLTPTQDNRLAIMLTEADGSALTSASYQTSEGNNIEADTLYIEWNEDHQGYSLFNSISEDAKQSSSIIKRMAQIVLI